MVFTEPAFLFIFLPFTIVLYFAVPGKFRNAVLLAASLSFYAAGEGLTVAVLLLCIFLTHAFGLWIENAGSMKRAKLFVALGIMADLAVLFVYKYSGFFIGNLNYVLSCLGTGGISFRKVALPLGLSFFTFKSMAYLLDIYRKTDRAQRNPFRTALYISLFPQLVAGPIERYPDVSGRLAGRTVTRGCFLDGMTRFITGLAKKKIVADTLAEKADLIFSIQTDQLTTGTAWIGAIFYTLQIYYDFSGYSDMAVGMGKMFGFQFPENFNYPYSARSIREFWRRWHITLSTWFRDYLYIPLGGGRSTRIRVYFNLLAVFILCGLWHGAAWKFLLWGFFHGTFIILERGGLSRLLDACPKVLGNVYTILVIIFGWVIFRADSLSHAGSFISAMIGLDQCSYNPHPLAEFAGTDILIVLTAATAGSFPVIPALGKSLARTVAGCRPRYAAVFRVSVSLAETALFAALALISILMVAAGTFAPFIYSNF